MQRAAHRDQEEMIALQDLRLTYRSGAGPVEVLRGIDLTIPPSETVSLVGPSGSGKTSLLMVISGLERATSGRVTVAGADLNALDEDDLAAFRRDYVGIVFQDFHLISTMTALENVAVPLEFAGRDDAFERAAQVLEQVGLGHRLDHYPGQLSGGEQQRVALARAFAPGPKLLLADEPTGNLDGETGARVVEQLFALQRAHATTLLLITHDTRLAERCNRVVRIGDGALVEDRRLHGNGQEFTGLEAEPVA
ncbi:ABC transporter ATP-binding protein [Aquibaculum sediminis]|uniref:ABC transporter ATP-binding protein n=1 Tax=Aquibaculum sediminis TaxID=3231907 RepID=UPI00345401A0